MELTPKTTCSPPDPTVRKIHPNKVAKRIVRMSKLPSVKPFSRMITRKYRALRKITPKTSEYCRPFTLEEINTALTQTKTGKAASYDCVYTEFLVNTGPRVRIWLARFFTNVMTSNKLPKAFKRAKIIALLKPGKPAESADSYRPISLLSVTSKLLERLIYNRIGDDIDKVIPPEQAGFRAGRSCTDQVMRLTNHIENGFQRKLKTGVVFVDLTAAYDTIWKRGLMYKLLKVIPCLTICDLIGNMLSDRFFQVHMNGDSSSWMKLNNGLPQGSVLSPLLFNLYIHDMPPSLARRFMYADDIAFAIQHKSFAEIESILTSVMAEFAGYCRFWRLNPSITKTETSCFHLNNRQAKFELEVQMNGRTLGFNPHPKYLGITLDRTLSYKHHLQKLRGKLAARNNVITKLASSSWGADAKTLRTSALALVYSTAEYCAPVWMNSSHTNLVDTQLNASMRLISGTVRSTPLQWLPALSNIAPPDLRRKNALMREYMKAIDTPDLPLYNDIQQPALARLKSRHPPLAAAEDLVEANFSVTVAWKERWTQSGSDNQLFSFGSERKDEFTLPRRIWCNLNRLRTQHGNCNDMLFKWKFIDTPRCPCGYPRQTIEHIMIDCPLMRYQGHTDDIRTLMNPALEWLRHLKL